MTQSVRLLPAVLLGVSAWLLVSLLSGPSQTSFLTATTGSARQSRTAMRGFKDDFYAWKDSLSKDEQSLLLKQAQNEFNKKFRKTEEFEKNVPDEKIQSFAKVLKKFFDNEKDDYKKDAGVKTPDYNALQNKAAQVSYDFGLKKRVVELDRDADRRWMFASGKMREAEKNGEFASDSAAMEEAFALSKEQAQAAHDFITKAMGASSFPAEKKAEVEKLLKENPVSDNFKVNFPRVMHERASEIGAELQKMFEDHAANHSEAEVQKLKEEQVPKMFEKLGELQEKYYEARAEIESDVQALKKFFKSQKKSAGKTKADVVKEIFRELPKHSKKPLPPLDEEMLSELAKIPAAPEGEFKHNWGTSDILYKSEAIDSFGNKYLLGVYETKAEADKAFDEWNKEYEQAGADVKESLSGWAKQQEAALAEDQDEVDRIRKQLEEVRR